MEHEDRDVRMNGIVHRCDKMEGAARRRASLFTYCGRWLLQVVGGNGGSDVPVTYCPWCGERLAAGGERECTKSTAQPCDAFSDPGFARMFAGEFAERLGDEFGEPLTLDMCAGVSGTAGWWRALRRACSSVGVPDVYRRYVAMEWDEADAFDATLLEMLEEFGDL